MFNRVSILVVAGPFAAAKVLLPRQIAICRGNRPVSQWAEIIERDVTSGVPFWLQQCIEKLEPSVLRAAQHVALRNKLERPFFFSRIYYSYCNIAKVTYK